ncbi:MAG: hypothetical protein M3O23_08230 [Actinomycetota bacterium]|nr:hypothetical protein [Actinomycetota bacterium]
MDLPPPAQEPGAARFQAHRTEEAASGELEWRLSQLEAGLRHIDRRLDRLEGSIAATVAEHTRAVARDLRHTVSELGRRLVLDLPQVLARHRDEIVAELRPPEPAPEPEPEPQPGPPAEIDLDPAFDPGEAVASAEAGEATAEAAAEAPSKRRRRVHVLRQRDA